MPAQISIVIPVYNRLDLLRETLASIAAQDFHNWECLLVDDGSEKDTLEFLIAWCDNDSRFVLMRKENRKKGASACRNAGWKTAASDLIMFMDSDDLLPETCLSTRINFITRNPNLDFWVFGTHHFFQTPGDSAYKWNTLYKMEDDLSRFIMHDNPWHTSGPVWTKRMLQKTCGFDEDAICWQDWEWHIRTLCQKTKYIKSEDQLAEVYYRKNLQSGQSSITAERITNIGAQWHIFKKIEAFLRLNDVTSSYTLPLSTTMYRVFEDAISHQKPAIAKEVLKFSRKNGYYSLVEQAVLFTLLHANRNSQRWLVHKCRRILQRLNPLVFHSKADHQYIFHVLLFGKPTAD
jgi:glycosyltransferase involved in cell wall biosynthesis